MTPLKTPLKTTVKATLGVALVVGTATALVGCSTGQVGTNAEDVSAVNGATTTLQNLRLLDVTIAHPKDGAHDYQVGESAPLTFTIANSGEQSDKLVSLSSSAAKTVTLSGTQIVPGGGSLATPTADNKDAKSVTATMTSLTSPVSVGPGYNVTFTFARSGMVTVPIPLANSGTPRSAS